MSRPPPKVRLFAALDLPELVRAELAAWARRAGEIEGVRVLASESLHVTLCFLGWREEGDAARIGGLLAACARPVPDLALGGVAWLPPRRPRVVAADVSDGSGALGALQAELSAVLEAEVAYEPEQRAYRPHVTVARLREGPTRPPDLDPPAPLAFAGAAVTVYRSHLRRGGARYEAVSRTAI